ncbi:transmembrane protein 94-like [Cyprinus carpio]|uniref:Transmembrane protein 94-like n=1 Tax=Cyprinus carpio TaxID=7962 RepID=A0A9Q9YGF4_CYPCA|nr:transmembrane protein 94-like [Cyprinus carpio]
MERLGSFTDALTASRLEMWTLKCKKCYSVFWGQTSTLCHTASFLHSLGSVTVLCCVDKQGILSWPSPNPENILFFSKSTSSQETDRQRQKEVMKKVKRSQGQSNGRDPFTLHSSDVKLVGGSGSVR